MKVIVAGSRTIQNRGIVIDACHEAPFTIDTLIHGGARGVDSLAADSKKALGAKDVVEIQPDYDDPDLDNEKQAPRKRNTKMAERADALVAIWDGESPGTRDMIKKALQEGLDIYVKQLQDLDVYNRE